MYSLKIFTGIFQCAFNEASETQHWLGFVEMQMFISLSFHQQLENNFFIDTFILIAYECAGACQTGAKNVFTHILFVAMIT